MELNRRRALNICGASLAAAISTREPLLAQKPTDGFGPLCFFAKPLQAVPFDELAVFMQQHDWDGIEATVRSGGQVEPAKVSEDLPRLVDALDAKKKKVVLFASDINSPNAQHVQQTLETASKLGIKYYRMKYYKYDLDKPILPQLDAFARQLEMMITVNKQLGMTGLYQNHAGLKYFGSGLWDMYRVLSEMPKEHLAVAFDIRHASVEAGTTWPIHWKMLKPLVGALYFKDFSWVNRRVTNVPLGSGYVSKSFYKDLQKQPIAVPVSVHMEYLDHKKPELLGDRMKAVIADRKAIRALTGV